MNLFDYIHGDRRGRAANRLERRALVDPLLADALEGFDAVDGPHAEAIARLRAGVRDRVSARARPVRMWTAVAATALLMLAVGGLWRLVLRPPAEPVLVSEMMDTAAPEAEVAAEPFVVEEEMIGITREDTTPREQPETPAAPAPQAAEAASQAPQQQVQVVADIIDVVSDDQRIESFLKFDDIADDAEFIFQPATAAAEEETPEALDEVVVTGYGDASAARIARSAAPADTTAEDAPFMTVSNMPRFQGGDLNAFRDWVQARLVYPTVAQENGIQGRVTVQFVIERDGRLTNIQVLGAPDHSLAAEAKRVVATSPRWTPGDNRGEPARVIFTLPLVFQLQ